MAAKFLVLFVIAAAFTQGHALTQIFLPDESYTFMTNELIGKSLTIRKSPFDTLLLCEVVYPDGKSYEAYPNNNMPKGPISFLFAVQPFTSCSIGFLGASVSHSGSYELSSIVRHRADDSLSLTVQRFHLTLFESSWTN
ncbi:uncharacterized protein LOC113505416 [Trichoplusia ni]|uniref:Uncharacterized protein LOC113505416 n=1 Tax=Trichoplusia ni TaxID=7111 RepID=A0A7E5WTK8_TRINI|nr:uncharacterized protein LOC113505416 [Trichoplusia ni]